MPLGGSDVSRLFIMRTMVGWPVFSFSYFFWSNRRSLAAAAGLINTLHVSTFIFQFNSILLSMYLASFANFVLLFPFSVDDNPLFTNYHNRHYFRYLRCTKKMTTSRP